MQLLDPATLRTFLGLPPDPEADEAVRSGLYHPGRESFDWLAAVEGWTEREYPDAPPIDRLSFAGLVAYLVTGWYGGYGTEEYAKERVAEELALALAGGLPPAGESIVAMTPPLDELGRPVIPMGAEEYTRLVWEVLVELYFGDLRLALSDVRRWAFRLPGERGVLAREAVLRVMERHPVISGWREPEWNRRHDDDAE